MLLKFHSKPDHCVYYPERRRAGQIYNYIGRRFVPATDGKTAGRHVPTDEPFVIDDEHQDSDTRKAAAILKWRCKSDSSIWPADEDTARACGVDYVPLVKGDDGWLPKPKRLPSKKD